MPMPPKHNPARRNARIGPVKLPAEGREGPVPSWPLPGRVSVSERKAWAQLWATPQAAAWERLGWVRTVARYCRVMVAAEARDAVPALLGQATALEDRLGLTPKAMRLLLWEIASDELAERRPADTSDVRQRIRAV